MMQKLWLKKPGLTYHREVFDIVQFGSSVLEASKPNDIDVAVIFKNFPVKEQLNQAQEIKNQLQKYSELPLHIKSFDLCSLFDRSNFALENIIFYGKSILSGNYFAEKLGFKPKIQLSYSLKDLKKKDKIRFHYMLKGKKDKYGLFKKYGGSLINPGLIEISPEHERIFTEKIKQITKNFAIKKILT